MGKFGFTKASSVLHEEAFADIVFEFVAVRAAAVSTPLLSLHNSYRCLICWGVFDVRNLIPKLGHHLLICFLPTFSEPKQYFRLHLTFACASCKLILRPLATF